jgi:hypothetical protein
VLVYRELLPSNSLFPASGFWLLAAVSWFHCQASGFWLLAAVSWFSLPVSSQVPDFCLQH